MVRTVTCSARRPRFKPRLFLIVLIYSVIKWQRKNDYTANLKLFVHVEIKFTLVVLPELKASLGQKNFDDKKRNRIFYLTTPQTFA